MNRLGLMESSWSIPGWGQMWPASITSISISPGVNTVVSFSSPYWIPSLSTTSSVGSFKAYDGTPVGIISMLPMGTI